MELNFALHVSAVASLHYLVVGEARWRLHSVITVIKIPLGFTEVCALKSESGRKEEEEEEEWAS